MAGAEELLATIEAVYAAGLDESLWPDALAAVMRTIGGISATLEVFDRSPLALLEFHSIGLPPPNELKYLDHYAAQNPRVRVGMNAKPGDLIADYMVLDERAMDRDPFYAEFLAPVGYRYCLIGQLDSPRQEVHLFSVQRATRQGHVDRAEMKLMKRLLPHVQRAFDMTRRLRGSADTRHSLEYALDWLADGVALIEADGSIVYANDSFREIARADDGVRIKKSALEFAYPAARDCFGAAVAGVLALRSGAVQAGGGDFVVARPSGATPYVISVRPLKGSRSGPSSRSAVAIVLVRNPSGDGSENVRLLREVFGLTNAEAGLALALRQGISLVEYARLHGISQNTVYTHLRRVREKTGCHRLPELIGKLNEARMLLRRG
jgi:DNA-binding CsgD family transcriptional regulator/PAS domain-containing protein